MSRAGPYQRCNFSSPPCLPEVMTPFHRLLVALPVLVQVACVDGPSTIVERHLDKSFDVRPGALVQVDLTGGSVTVVTGQGRQVRVALRQEVTTADGDRAADRLLAAYEISATSRGGDVEVIGRRTPNRSLRTDGRNRVRLAATVIAPADVRLDLNTSGGRVRISGERDADVQANTRGGAVEVDGGRGPLRLSTSGGRVAVGRALGVLHADTRGGSITVDYVGASAGNITLNTSGGNIRAGVDARAALAVDAVTSGGSISVEGLAFDGLSERWSSLSGIVNGGRNGALRASTSGGNIRLSSSADPGARVVGERGARPVPASNRDVTVFELADVIALAR